MAATKKRTANRNGSNIPAGYKRVDLRPQQVVTEIGTVLHGTLGPVERSKNDMPDYRSIRTDDGLFYVPSHASLRGVLSMTTGAAVYLECVDGEGTKNAPWIWEVSIPDGDAVPF
jgi:hypothetical protein